MSAAASWPPQAPAAPGPRWTDDRPSGLPLNNRGAVSMARAMPSADTAGHGRRGAWFHYRNARMWGKPILWSIRYAREANARFA